MRLIRTNEEMQELTGSWYESNVFSRIHTDVDMETDDLAKLIGRSIIIYCREIYNKAESERTDIEKELLRKVQLPIAFMATYRYYQSNIVSHESTSRTVQIDKGNESMPWEWMLDRDDYAQLLKAQRATDSLIEFLEEENIEQWKTSKQCRALRSLFINNTAQFQRYYPIDNSARFYLMATPFLREIQGREIKKALGEEYESFLSDFKAGIIQDDDLYELVCSAQAIYTIALAVRRLPMQVLPEGLLKRIRSSSQTANALQAAELDEIKRFSMHLEIDAENMLDEIKKYRYQNSPEYLEQTFLPKNDPRNKYART